MIYRSIDFETTGLPVRSLDKNNSTNHAVIEGGWCDLIDKGNVILEPRSEVVNPGRDCDLEALAVHHIQPCDWEGKRSPDRMFMDIMNPRPDYFVAHNVEMEQAFFGGGDVPWICTYRVALREWPEAPAHSLQMLRYWLKIDTDADFERDLALRPHRAPDDAYVTSFLLRRLLYKGVDIADMVRWSKGPALLSRMTFGKHVGKFWKDVAIEDRGYLDWIVNKSDFDDRNVLATARYYLKQTAKT